jgi:hypothetical protein
LRTFWQMLVRDCLKTIAKLIIHKNHCRWLKPTE